MVYESDFYTTRRPYSAPRPTITSYSVTLPRVSGIAKAQTFHHTIPFVAHKRLTTTSAPLRSVRVRPSIILAEIDRINYKVRPSLAYQPTEDYLNSRSSVSFDDETRSIRAQTAALLKRIHEPLPRASRPLPVILSRYQPRATWYQPTVIWYPRQHGARYQPHVTWYLPHETKYPHVIRYPHETRYHHVTRYPYENSYEDTPIPHRITSDAYINRMLNSTRDVQKDIINMSHYNDPASRSLGKGHLACVTFAGGRGYPRRKNLFHDDDRVRNDVTFLSHYEKTREAANRPQGEAKGTAEKVEE